MGTKGAWQGCQGEALPDTYHGHQRSIVGAGYLSSFLTEGRRAASLEGCFQFLAPAVGWGLLFMAQDERRVREPLAHPAWGAGNTLANDQWMRFEAIYQHYYPDVLGFLRFLVGTPEVAEDLASVVFEKALTHLAEMRTPAAAGVWLFRIARNCAADYFRRYKPAVSLDDLLPTEHPQAASVEEAALAREEERSLLAHLGRLSEREREVIGLKFVACLSNREIAGALQIPEGTVASLLHRALRRLRDALDEEGGHHER